MDAREAGRSPALRSAATLAGLAAILAVFVLVRLPLLTKGASVRGWNGDSAIYGLMAKKIHDGRGFDVFFWGQNYMGPLTPALAAGIRKAVLDPAGIGEEGGPISLRLASMGEIAFGISLFCLGLARLFGWPVATAAGLWMAIGPPWFVRLSALYGSELGPEMAFAIGSILFFLAAGALTRERPILLRPAGLVALGLLGGVGWWMNQTVVFVLVPAFALAFLRAGPFGAARVLAGAALGYLPVWLGRALDWYPPAAGPVLPPLRLGQAPERLVDFAGVRLWNVVGLEGLAPPWVLGAAGLGLAAVIVASALRAPEAQAGARPAPGALPFVGLVAGLGAAMFVLLDVNRSQARYVAPALPALLAILVAALAQAGRLLRRRLPSAAVALAGVGLACALAVFLARNARAAVALVLRAPDRSATLRTILDEGYAVCHAGYDAAYTLQFLSDERVRFVPYHGPDRNRALSAELRALPGPQCLVTDDGLVRRWLPSDAATEGSPAQRRANAR